MCGLDFKVLSNEDKKKVEYLLNNFCGGHVNQTVLDHIFGTFDTILAEHLNKQIAYLRKNGLVKIAGK